MQRLATGSGAKKKSPIWDIYITLFSPKSQESLWPMGQKDCKSLLEEDFLGKKEKAKCFQCRQY